MDDVVTRDRYRRYLLGQLPDDEQDALEESYFGTDEALALLQAAEDDLLDAYEAGALAPEDRGRFEAIYLGDREGARRVTVDRALKRLARRRTPGSVPATASPWLRWAAVVALAALAGAYLWSHLRFRDELREAGARNEALQRQADGQAKRIDEETHRLDALRSELKDLRERAEQLEDLAAEPAGVASLVLRAGLARSLQPVAQLSLPPRVGLVRITLGLENDTGRPYRASLQTVEGRELWSRAGLGAIRTDAGPAVRITLPAASLPAGHHVIVLSAESAPASPLAEYVFQVRRP